MQFAVRTLAPDMSIASVMAEAAQPALFPPLCVGIVRAAEGTSDLPRALERFIAYQQRIDAVRAIRPSGHPAGGGRRRQPVPDGQCGASLRRGLRGAGRTLPYSLSMDRPLKVANFDARFQNQENKKAYRNDLVVSHFIFSKAMT